jgi:hypothetical protein
MTRFKSALLAATVLFGFASAAIAQTGPTYDPAQLPATKGKVSQYLLNPHGGIDGLLLDDGTEVHVNPMLSTEIAFSIRPGDAVTIHGLKAKASPMVAAASITNDATGTTVTGTTVTGRMGRPARGPENQMEASGVVKAALHEPRGGIDGVLLDNGTIIRLPPSEAKKFAGQIAVGQKLFVRGMGTSSALGKVVIARQIGADASKLADVAMPHLGGHEGMMRGHDGKGPMMGHRPGGMGGPMGAPPASN